MVDAHAQSWQVLSFNHVLLVSTSIQGCLQIPSGKLTLLRLWKIIIVHGNTHYFEKAIFNGHVNHYQRVSNYWLLDSTNPTKYARICSSRSSPRVGSKGWVSTCDIPDPPPDAKRGIYAMGASHHILQFHHEKWPYRRHMS